MWIIRKKSYLLTIVAFAINHFFLKAQPFNSIQKKFYSSLNSFSDSVLKNGSFKNSVFFIENVYLDSTLVLPKIDSIIRTEKAITKKIPPSITKNFKVLNDDTTSFQINSSLFKLFKDTTRIITTSTIVHYFPYSFNHLDPLGKQDFTSTFVTTLLETHKGNCKSLSYLYKILADEMGAKCWLSLAPRHIYIKNYSTQTGWYNTELTNGSFPNNGWLMASGYITLDAIKSGLYMDTLSNQQAIANLAIDLALVYQRKTRIQADSFIIKCCDLTLLYHPVNPNALLLKAETMKQMYLAIADNTTLTARYFYTEMEKVYFKLYNLGYRQMPEKMYNAWLKELEVNKKKYEL